MDRASRPRGNPEGGWRDSAGIRSRGVREEKKNREASGPYFWHCGRRPTGLGLADLIGGGLPVRLLKEQEKSRRHSEALLMELGRQMRRRNYIQAIERQKTRYTTSSMELVWNGGHYAVLSLKKGLPVGSWIDHGQVGSRQGSCTASG